MKNICPKIDFHPLLLFFALLSILTAHFKDFFTFMLIIFVHECGHFLFACLFHWKIEKIIFLPFGGMIKFHEKLNRPIYQEFLILIGGPLFQIIFYYFYPTIYHYPLLIFNLLPIYPLDGSKFVFLFFNLCVSYYHSYLFLGFLSYFSIFLLFICYPSMYLLLLSIFLLFQQIRFMSEIPSYFLTFLFERYEKDYPYYQEKIIKGKNVKKMKRSVRYVFFYNQRFYTEKEHLKIFFQRK